MKNNAWKRETRRCSECNAEFSRVCQTRLHVLSNAPLSARGAEAGGYQRRKRKIGH